LRIPQDEFSWTFVRSGGPGGQNVNKAASKAVLRWNVVATPTHPDAFKDRLQHHHHRPIPGDADFFLPPHPNPDKNRNRLSCLEKLAAMIRAAATTPKTRRKTKPSRGAHERRLAAKKKRSALKAARRVQGE